MGNKFKKNSILRFCNNTILCRNFGHLSLKKKGFSKYTAYNDHHHYHCHHPLGVPTERIPLYLSPHPSLSPIALIIIFSTTPNVLTYLKNVKFAGWPKLSHREHQCWFRPWFSRNAQQIVPVFLGWMVRLVVCGSTKSVLRMLSVVFVKNSTQYTRVHLYSERQTQS